MKRNWFSRANRAGFKQAALAIPAAALMLGQSQAGTTVGINFWGNYFGFYYGGRVVSSIAFGLPPANWNTTPAVDDPAAATNSIATGPGDALSLAWSAPYTGVSGMDSTNTPALSQGDSDVFYGFLDGGQPGDPGYSVSLGGLAARFPSGYVIQVLASADSGTSFSPAMATDGLTTQTLANPIWGVSRFDAMYAIGQGSGVFSGDTVMVSSDPAAPPQRATIAGFLVTDQPVISQRPTGGGTVNPGDSFLLSASGIGLPPLAYQWRLNGVPIPGATKTTYSSPAAGDADAGTYDLVVTNSLGTATSDVVILTVTDLPGIVRDVVSLTNYTSLNASLSVQGAGAAPLAYQWFKDRAPIAGANGAALALANLQTADTGDYEVVITNSLGAATSSAAAVTVLTNLPPYEPFAYTAGLLSSQGTDPAWGGAWEQNTAHYNGEQTVIQPGATWQAGGYTLVTTGGAAQLAGSGTEDYEDDRALLASLGGPAGGTLYCSFLGQVTNTVWAGVELALDGQGAILLGANPPAQNWAWGDRSNTNPLCGHSSISSAQPALLVYRFDFTPTNTVVRLYVNPGLGAEPATPSATGSWTNFWFDQVRLVAHGQTGSGAGPNGFIDELRLGGSWGAVTPAPLVVGAGRNLLWSYGTLQSSPTLGPTAVWANVPGATSPYPLPGTGTAMFYRLAAP